MVFQDPTWFAPPAMELAEKLKPFLKQETIGLEWPGTLLAEPEGGEGANIYQYRLIPESGQILKSVANGLYDWVRPELPEDLCLMRPGGSPWLVSIAHEKDSYLELTSEEKELLCRAIPDLKDMLEL